MDSTYAPQSPDLSSFPPSPSKQQQQQQYQSTSQYTPQSPNLSSFNAAPSPHRNLHTFQDSQSQSFGGDFGEYKSHQYMPEIPALPSTHNSFNSSNHLPTSQYFSAGQPDLQPYQNHIKIEASYNAYTPPPPSDMSSRGARQPRALGQASSSMADAPAYKNPNPSNIEIKTKFPVARIKRIMQADEEVGKVAQVTPVAVSKALELFMISLVSSAAEKAKEKGGKRVTAQHLKQVVTEGDQFDFLVDIVSKISEAQEGAGGDTRKRKEKSVATDSDHDEPKKPKKGKGRRKKNDD